jgi:hypothetical protein
VEASEAQAVLEAPAALEAPEDQAGPAAKALTTSFAPNPGRLEVPVAKAATAAAAGADAAA